MPIRSSKLGGKSVSRGLEKSCLTAGSKLWMNLPVLHFLINIKDFFLIFILPGCKAGTVIYSPPPSPSFGEI